MNSISLNYQISQIQKCSNFKEKTLSNYFGYIFDQISIRSTSENKKVCDLKNFTIYLNLPLILSKRVMKIFETNQDKTNNNDKDLLTQPKFVEVLLKFYFGTSDEMIENFFKLFDTENSKNLNLNDLMLVVKFLTNNETTIKNFEHAIKKFNKKSNLMSDFQTFKNYILCEEMNLIINLYKLIFQRQPFTKNVLKYFEFLTVPSEVPDDDESVTSLELEEHSSQQEVLVNEFDNSDKSKQITLYKFINNKFKKFKVVIIDNHIFFFNSNSNIIKDYSFSTITSANFYCFSQQEAFIDSRKLFCLELQLKLSNNIYTLSPERLYFKTNLLINQFLSSIKAPKTVESFFKEHSTIKLLGKGENGKVILVNHNITNEKFAVKIINKNSVKIDSLILNKMSTISFLKSNPHENIVNIYDILEDCDNLYVLMEYIKNTLSTMLDYIKTDDQKTDIIKQISNGLLFLHSNGIIHRDIKSDNIMIEVKDEKLRVKIVDFGFSKVILENELAYESYGTLIYAAPEIIKRTSYTNKVDIWSLGNLLFQIHYKYLPFDGFNNKLSNVASRICNYDVSEQLKPSINKIDRIIQGCLIKDPVLRLNINKVNELVNSL